MRRGIAGVLCCGAVIGALSMGINWSGIRSQARRLHDPTPASDPVQPSEAEILTESFFDLAEARSLTMNSTSSAEAQSSQRMELVDIPLKRIPGFRNESTVRSDARFPIGHLLLLVERLKHEPLYDARVVGFMLRPSGSNGACLVEPANGAIGYLVLAKTVSGGLNATIFSFDRHHSSNCKVGDLQTNPINKWPNDLRVVAETRKPIIFPADASLGVSATLEEDEIVPRFNLTFHNFRRPACDPKHVLEYTYSAFHDEWSAVPLAQSSDEVWALDESSTEVVSVLRVPPKQIDRTVGIPASPKCLAIVQQRYRGKDPSRNNRGCVSTAFWVVECSPDCDLTNAIGLGVVIHPRNNSTSTIAERFSCARACLACDNSTRKYYLCLAGFVSSAPAIYLYEVDRNMPLSSPPMILGSNSNVWPPQMDAFVAERLPYGGGGGSWADRLFDICGSPMMHAEDSCVALATFSQFGSKMPTKIIHGFDLKRKLAIAASFAEVESPVTTARHKSIRETTSQKATVDEWELIPSSTRVVSVLPNARGGHSRSLVAVEQKYRTVGEGSVSVTRVLWILECDGNCSIARGIPVGIHYMTATEDACMGISFVRSSPCTVVTADGGESALTLRLFSDNFIRPLTCKPLALGRSRNDWPSEMVPVSSLETGLVGSDLGVLSATRELDDSIIVRATGNAFGENSYRYRSSKNQWSGILLSAIPTH